jgi:diamine N-acetyltransferase
MLYDDPEKSEYFLWRFMIDERYQKLDFGRHAMELLIDYVKTRPGANELYVSHSEGEGNPGGFYGRLGFKYTGEVDHGELVMKLVL